MKPENRNNNVGLACSIVVPFFVVGFIWCCTNFIPPTVNQFHLTEINRWYNEYETELRPIMEEVCKDGKISGYDYMRLHKEYIKIKERTIVNRFNDK